MKKKKKKVAKKRILDDMLRDFKRGLSVNQVESLALIDAGLIPHDKYNCPGCPIH